MKRTDASVGCDEEGGDEDDGRGDAGDDEGDGDGDDVGANSCRGAGGASVVDEGETVLALVAVLCAV
ncbi:MAG TPA: hypothetical protein VF064_04740, partial [Pyrinomonadaceae bacterium]